jgi:DivIVA domain-containing protein
VGDDDRDRPGEEAGSARLTPEDIAYRSFAGARRGLSEPQVREFLEEIASQVAAAQERERELEARIEQLGHRLANPPPLTETQILDTLGEETTRVLRSAQEAAEEIRTNAGGRAEAMIREAEEEAKRVRETADDFVSERTREAEATAAAVQKDADNRAQAQMREAGRDAEAELEGARLRGREMVTEARSVRERILTDLGKRRSVLEAEVERLQVARERLEEAGRSARRSLGVAAEALVAFERVLEEQASAEAAPAAEPAAAMVEPAVTEPAVTEPAVVVEEELRAPGPTDEEAEEPLPSEEAQEPVPSQDAEEAPDEEAEKAPPGEEAEAAETAPAREPEPVEDLFARIRAGREQATPARRAQPAERGLEGAMDDGTVADAPEPAEPAGAEPAPEDVEAEREGEEAGPDRELLQRREDVLGPLGHELLRKCKRALQDEQNELLDQLRRQRRRSGARQLLPTARATVSQWADLLEPAVHEAYAAGHGAHSERAPTTSRAPRRLVSGLAEVLVAPLRERLESAVDTAPGDRGPEREAEIASLVGARYREWRAQELEYRVGDALAAAYARGVYDGAPEGSKLRWIAAEPGRCPDCDDNALETTTRGANFPTGQPFPPAHPGCRCVLTIDDRA